MIQAARDLFVSNGFEQTSLDMVIARTGGSRRNIYALFGDKQGLFEAVLKDLMDNVLERTSVPEIPDAQGSVRDQLIAIGRAFLHGTMDPLAQKTLRQFIVVAAERPDIGRQAYEAGPAVLYRQLENYLGRLVEQDRLALNDVGAAARMLVEMFKADFQIRALLVGEMESSPAVIDAHVQRAVDLFLDGARPRLNA